MASRAARLYALGLVVDDPAEVWPPWRRIGAVAAGDHRLDNDPVTAGLPVNDRFRGEPRSVFAHELARRRSGGGGVAARVVGVWRPLVGVTPLRCEACWAASDDGGVCRHHQP